MLTGRGEPEESEAVPMKSQPAVAETGRDAPTHEEIAARAYEHWQKRGGVPGDAEDDWWQAEQELRKERKRVGAKKQSAAASSSE